MTRAWWKGTTLSQRVLSRRRRQHRGTRYVAFNLCSTPIYASKSVPKVYHQDSGGSLGPIAKHQSLSQQISQEERDFVRKPPPGYQEPFQETNPSHCFRHYRRVEAM